MNRDALRYELDGRGIHYDEKHAGFVVYADGLPPGLVREIGACGGQLEIGGNGTPPVFIVREVMRRD